jgi:(E)-4-hydroxy-3-methylbut-2-enyl-diphosphate synthase
MLQVESALEFARICQKLDFHKFVFSMKAKHITCLWQKCITRWDYPSQLGVTEAGEGEDGRMKSAIGIGTLLMVIASLLIYVV